MFKTSNSIVIGGPIAVGKSTLIKSLPFSPVYEFNSNDELQSLLLHKMYEGNKIAPKIFQLDILLTKFYKYKKLADNTKTSAFERSIFEDIFFAKNLFKNQLHIWNYYKSIWDDKVKEVITKIGKPKFYVLLTCSWDSFEQRLFKRKRLAEVSNFQSNKEYFQNMIKTYEKYMVKMFKSYNLDYAIINTDNLSGSEVVKKVRKKLQEKGIL